MIRTQADRICPCTSGFCSDNHQRYQISTCKTEMTLDVDVGGDVWGKGGGDIGGGYTTRPPIGNWNQ